MNLDLLIEDINDHVDETPSYSLIAIEDMDTAVTKAETLRSQFRSDLQLFQKLVDDYQETYGDKYSDQLKKIKTYIQTIKASKLSLRKQESNFKTEKETEEFNKNKKCS